MQIFKYYYNNVIKYDVINKFYYKKYKQIPKIIKIVLSFNCKNLNIKQLLNSLIALELISAKKGFILVSKKSNILLKIKKGNPTIELLGSCRIDNGIGLLSESEQRLAIKDFENSRPNLNISFFIPSSGSGSRMFGAAYTFLNQGKPDDRSIEFIEHLINSIETFAFYNKLSQDIKDDLKKGTIEIEPFLKHLLSSDGFNFGNRPKGLIPFHRYGNFIINPFQEHIKGSSCDPGFHYTL